MRTDLIFDLDGTLIDSAGGILEGFRLVLDEAGQRPCVPVDSGLIGPPLRITLARLAGTADPGVIEPMARRFVDWYDQQGYRRSAVYPGVAEALCELRAAGCRLSIVTNKRIAPTRAILAWLGWTDWFSHVDTHDAQTDAPLGSKADVIARLLRTLAASPSRAVYIGDRLDDWRAAEANQLACTLVAWGYGSAAEYPAGAVVVSSPTELVRHLKTA